MSKERPSKFDPHPGDPWHPEWAVEADELAAAASEHPDGAWWRKALRRPDSDELPEAYAALEEDEPAAQPEPTTEPVPNSEPELEPDSVPDPAISVVARAFEERLGVAEKSTPSLPVEVPTATVVADPEPEIRIDLRHEEDETPGAESDTESTVLAAAVAPDPEPEPDPEPDLDPGIVAEQLESRTANAAVRAGEHAAELTLVARLATAEASAHEESAMWSAVAAAREGVDGSEHGARTDMMQRAPLDDSWAEEAIAMEESRQRLDQSRLRSEAEVWSSLDRGVTESPEVPQIDEAAVAARFAAIATQLRLEASADSDRQERKEQLRLRTSLLVLDAEAPWRESGWSRPGGTFGNGATELKAPTQVNLLPIATTIPPTVAESPDRRRWPWSRKRITASVTVLEERSVSENGELGDEEQPELPFAEASDADTPFDVDADEAEGWEDWALGDAEDDPLAELAEGAGARDDDQPEIAEAQVVTEAEAVAESDLADWEDFTAGEYVQTATQEYADLAAAVAAAEESEAPQQAAIAADMPGLESSLVGLEDVVEAEGMEAAEAAPRSDLARRVSTALALVILFFASLTYSWAIGLLVIIVMVMAAGELATVLLRQSYHPVTLFAYLGTLGLLLGTWGYGLVAIPFVVATTLLVVLLYFGLVAGREDPLTSMTLTLLSVLWVGVFAAFAMDMVNAAEYRWLIGSLVVVVAVMDMAQYFVGRRFGKRLLAPVVSPKKTVAGLVGGVVAAVGTGFGLSFIAPFDQVTGVVLGAALAITGPIGDLAVSVLKRTLAVKDMGTILPGHGGILDRIDAILFSLPAAWLVYAWASLLV